MKHDNVAFQRLAELLRDLTVGEPLPIGGIHLVPLLRGGAGCDAQLLHEALDDGVTRVEELDESGNVNMIRVRHEGAQPLLLLDGDEIVGAKQNRMFNASFVVEPGATANIPVSCVERGRWANDNYRFSSSPSAAVTSVRASKVTRVASSVATGRGYDADQGQVWRDVDAYLNKSCIGSPTSAMADAKRARSRDVEDLLGAVTVAGDQVGLAGVHADSLLFLDVFASPALYGRAWKRIARSLLLDVHDGAASHHPAGAVAAALSDVRSSALVGSPAPGGGTTVCGSGQGNVLTAIVRDGQPYHTVIAPR